MNNYHYNAGSDSNSRLRASQAPEQGRREKRLGAFEREYRTRVSSIADTQTRLQESLLAHSIRVRSTAQRGRIGEYHDSVENEGLIVRAKPIRRCRGRGERKILTLQELLSRGPNTRVAPMTIAHEPQPSTGALQYANNPPTPKQSRGDYLKLNLISASDLNDFGDLPKFGKSPPALPIKPDIASEKEATPRKLSPLENKSDIYQKLTENATKDFYVFISSDDDESKTGSKLLQRNLEPLHNIRKRRISARYSRMKRMKLPAATLDLIPENDPTEEKASPDIEVSGKQLDFKNPSAYKGHLRLRNTGLEPLNSYTVHNIISRHGASVNPIRTSHRKRENEKKVAIDMETVVPRKRFYKPSYGNEANGTRSAARDEVRPTSGDNIISRRTGTHHREDQTSISRRRYGRLVFLVDRSP